MEQFCNVVITMRFDCVTNLRIRITKFFRFMDNGKKKCVCEHLKQIRFAQV